MLSVVFSFLAPRVLKERITNNCLSKGIDRALAQARARHVGAQFPSCRFAPIRQALSFRRPILVT